MQSVKRRQQLLAEQAKNQKEIDKIDEELKALTQMLPEEAMAVVVHDMTCTSNHTDGCGWFYEVKKNVHDWNKDTHKRYLKNATLLHEYCNEAGRGITREDVAAILSMAKGY
jgi:hypothetical protein